MVENSKKILINLLPHSVIEKRQSEKFMFAGFFVLAVLVGLMVFVFGVNFVRVAARQKQVNKLVSDNTRYGSAIAQIDEFESRKALVEQRRQLVEKVGLNDFEWSRFLNNISLIVPSDIWIKSITGDQEKITFEGSAPSAEDTSTEMGHTAVAKWLVHLGEISSLKDVWLDASEKLVDKDNPVPQIDFKTTAYIKDYKPEEAASAAKPAPPAVPGGNPQ